MSHMLERQVLMMQQAELQPHSCSSLGEQYELVRSVYGLRQRLAKLRHQLSDASLQQVRNGRGRADGVACLASPHALARSCHPHTRERCMAVPIPEASLSAVGTAVGKAVGKAGGKAVGTAGAPAV